MVEQADERPADRERFLRSLRTPAGVRHSPRHVPVQRPVERVDVSAFAQRRDWPASQSDSTKARLGRPVGPGDRRSAAAQLDPCATGLGAAPQAKPKRATAEARIDLDTFLAGLSFPLVNSYPA